MYIIKSEQCYQLIEGVEMKKICTYVMIGILLFVGCSSSDQLIRPSLDHVETMGKIDVISYDRIQRHVKHEATLTAVGDIMFHIWQLNRAYDSTTDTFDFSHAFRHLKPYLTESDFTVGNLETTFAGKNNGRMIKDREMIAGYSGYPYFNTPEAAARNIKEAGFDLLNTANNHALDSRYEGVLHTLDVLDEAELLHVGTYRNQEESEEVMTLTINQMSFSFIGYTYGTNGLPLPEEAPYSVSSLEMDRNGNVNEAYYEAMLQKVKKADEMDTDFIIVLIHFGNEIKFYPNVHQRKIVDDLFEAGADVILGTHPHVLQPIDIRTIKDADGTERKGIVIYSLGNFVSSQRYDNTDIGTLFTVHFEKIDYHQPKITKVSLVPTLCYRNKEEISVLPVCEAYEHIENYPLKLSSHELKQLEHSKTYTIQHLMTYIKDHYSYTYSDYRYHIPLDKE